MRQRGPLIAAAGGVLVVLLMIFVLIMPKVSAVHKKQDALEAAQARQTELEAHLHELQATEKRAQEIRAQLAKLDANVPPTADLPGLIRTLNDMADQASVDFLSLSPGQPSAVQGASAALPAASAAPPPAVGGSTAGGGLPLGVSVVPVSITLNGTYFACDEYLFLLETMPRISTVTSISLALGPSGYPQLALTLQANFFTTDTSAGPGSEPGSQGAGAPQGSPAPAPSPSGTASPTPSSTSG